MVVGRAAAEDASCEPYTKLLRIGPMKWESCPPCRHAVVIFAFQETGRVGCTLGSSSTKGLDGGCRRQGDGGPRSSDMASFFFARRSCSAGVLQTGRKCAAQTAHVQCNVALHACSCLRAGDGHVGLT